MESSPTSDGSRAYTWDVRNRLASLSGGASASFVYDPTGRRQAKTVSGTTTKFLYDGLNTIQELDSGLTPTANLRVGLGIDETFVRNDGAARYLLPDALGSTLALTDATPIVKTSYTYEPYGETTSSGDASTNAFQFTGRENDSTGLYYYRARYYLPGSKRFVSEDPIGLAGGTNVFAYVEGDPVSLNDPEGELAPQLAGAALGFLGNVAYQLWTNGGNFACVDLWQAGSWAMAGAGLGALGSLARTVPGFAKNSLPHIFKNSPGHVNPATAASQQRFQNLFQQVASNSSNLNNAGLPQSALQNGVQQFTQNFNAGQVWVQTRAGQIFNAGVNRAGGFR